ncbi:hypothetical protein QWY31_02985 [Cytophagales bacterium LB-30]|uniref:MipA/OmpV family protein n=1 Tax=Shiella aurantiaca TaxID=3058365 RepID=A0ABT8F211_9BACT|nr:hypothetical protein [Shiella aurantiaca]MDN4164447.1 hypothetical protein [Shiella aurantiaca]
MKIVSKHSVLLLLLVVSPLLASAQLNKTRSAVDGMLINVRMQTVLLADPYALYSPHQKHGWYPSFGFELQQYDYSVFGLRQRLDFDMAAEAIYLLIRMASSGDWNDPDGRFGTTSYFNTIFLEYVPQIPLYTNYFMSTGLGGALYDISYTHYLYDENGEPENPQKSDASHYGIYGGWSAFIDIMLHESLTLHTDYFYGYSFYSSAASKLNKMDEPTSAFRSWKITSTLLHKSGLFVSGRFHQFVNRTDIPTEASRLSLGIGYRFGMRW